MSDKGLNERQQGFTLIELMIVVALFAVLLAVAVPSYRNYVLRAGRIDATAALMQVAASQERFYAQNGIYASNAQLKTAAPNGLGFSTAKSERGYYDVTIAAGAGGLTTGYTLTATVDMAEKQKGDSDCASFSLNEEGQRGANGGYDDEVVDKCWR